MHRLTKLSLNYPKATVLLTLLVTAVMAVGAARVETVYGHRVLIGDEHPSIVELDRFIEKFGGGLPAIVMWDCSTSSACEHPLDRPSLELSDAFARKLLPMSAVREVTGPSNAPLLTAVEGGFTIRRLMEHGVVVADHDELAKLALVDELWTGQIVSRDGVAGLIIVEPVSDQPPADIQIVDQLLELKKEWEARGFEISLGGSIVNSVIGTRELIASQEQLTPVTVVLAGLVLMILSGSVKRSIFSLIAVGTALIWTLGALGFFAWPQDSVLQVLAPLILIVGVCDSIHFLNVAQNRLSSGHPWKDALDLASRAVSLPCVLTTATTVGAFLSFLTSGLDTFVRFGSIASIGVSFCLLATFTVLPALCILFEDPRSSKRPARADGSLRALVSSVAQASAGRARTVLTITVAILVFFGFGWATRLSVAVDWHESFGESSSIVQWDKRMDAHFGAGDMRLELELAVPPGTRIEEPSSINVLKSVMTALGRIEGLIEPRSITDYMESLQRLLVEDAKAVLPDSQAGNAELIELIGFSDTDLLGYWLSFDRSSARISAQTRTISSKRVQAIMSAVRDAIESIIPPGWTYTITGGVGITQDWVSEVQSTQVRSFPVAFAIVWVLVGLFLRSVPLGLASMIPSLIPVVVTLGAMGWLGMTLDVSRAMIAAVILGIGVDDSVHILAHYKSELEAGHDPSSAILAACEGVGVAVVTTSIALSIGFLSLMASAWQSISSFGFFVSLAILGALVSTLVVLPAWITFFWGGKRRGG